MTEAWQVREYQRQQLVEKLLKKIWNFLEQEEISGDWFYYQLAIRLFEKIKPPNTRNFRTSDFSAPVEDMGYQVHLIIDAFSRTPEEYAFVLLEFLKKIIEQATSPIIYALRRQEFLEPEKIYGAKAMDKIEWPNEDEVA